MTSSTLLVDGQQDRVAIAINAGTDKMLRVTGGQPLFP